MMSQTPLWDILFKINNILLPFVFAWGIWVTNYIYELRANDKNQLPIAAAIEMEVRMKDWTRINFSPMEVKESIKDVVNTLDVIKDQLRDLKYELKINPKRGG